MSTSVCPTSTPSAASEVAPGWSAGAAATFSPIPTTTAGRCGSATSARMPATLRCAGPSSRSLGHLRPQGTVVSPRTASYVARPASRVSQPSFDAEMPSGRSSTLTVSPEPGGETQLRASRPRPASWCSAMSTVRSGAPAAAAASRSALVEPVRSTMSTRVHSPTSAARTASWSSGRAVRFMRANATAVGVILW